MPTKAEFNINIENYLRVQRDLIDRHFKTLLDDNKYTNPKELWDPVKYSLFNGGKRVRGILCLATYESIIENKLSCEDIDYDCKTVACSIELIHAMSLIHDDLPSMDNDDFRRGKPSNHKAFGEATAILAGDAMLSLAFQLVAENTKKISKEQKNEIVKFLSRAFTLGLVPGQILDLLPIKEKNNLKTIENIATLKTAELIKASVMCGASIANKYEANNPDIKKALSHIESFGLKIGVAFQIIDDILDVTSDTKTLGKTSGKDEKQNKSTYPFVIGIESSKKMAQDLVLDAKSELKRIPIESPVLYSLADYILNRIS
ncbi:MAG: polyprenyl synthetase family protein [Candidatus Melainabacteria bacterium]|nr:polyprenyl synthetase family protein [Candidatus Melainabacteria bacterium]